MPYFRMFHEKGRDTMSSPLAAAAFGFIDSFLAEEGKLALISFWESSLRFDSGHALADFQTGLRNIFEERILAVELPSVRLAYDIACTGAWSGLPRLDEKLQSLSDQTAFRRASLRM